MVKEYIRDNIGKTIRTNLEDKSDLIGLPYPYTVPCADGIFQEMYYWDTYFTNVGLLEFGMAEQAKNNTDNVLYMIERYGFMPNGSRTYYLSRSQPPYASLMVKDVYNHFKDIEWLGKAYKTLEKEYEFWQTKRITPNGLNYYGTNNALDDFRINTLYEDFQKRAGKRFDKEENKLEIAQTVCTFVESGWDCNNRFEKDGFAYNPVCLNSLLFGLEKNMADFAEILDNDEQQIWQERAEKRKQKMEKYMLNPQNGLFMDWNFKEQRFSPVVSAASLYPLFVKLRDDASNEIPLINKLLLKYGVTCSIADDYEFPLMQWDYPNVWPPIQFIAYRACENYAVDEHKNKIAQAYVSLIERSMKKTGNLWEKYDGNTGEVTSNEYEAPIMLGWTAGVYIYLKNRI